MAGIIKEYSIYVFFGLAPSIIWLLFYLRKDHHPEPNRMVLKVFFYGMLFAFLAALVEIAILKTAEAINPRLIENSLPFFFLYNLLGIAFIEELAKYIVVRQRVLHDPAFDEPVDSVLYLIISALGFAALENILVLLPASHPLAADEITKTAILRFVGATFLHALCSGTVGYFLALGLCDIKKRHGFVILGLAIASFLHALYNFSIIKLEDQNYYIFLPIIIISGLAVFVSFGFKHLKKKLSTCKITK